MATHGGGKKHRKQKHDRKTLVPGGPESSDLRRRKYSTHNYPYSWQKKNAWDMQHYMFILELSTEYLVRSGYDAKLRRNCQVLVKPAAI